MDARCVVASRACCQWTIAWVAFTCFAMFVSGTAAAADLLAARSDAYVRVSGAEEWLIGNRQIQMLVDARRPSDRTARARRQRNALAIVRSRGPRDHRRPVVAARPIWRVCAQWSHSVADAGGCPAGPDLREGRDTVAHHPTLRGLSGIANCGDVDLVFHDREVVYRLQDGCLANDHPGGSRALGQRAQGGYR